MRALAILALIASPAFADPVHSVSGSIIRLQLASPLCPGAVAEIVFENQQVNGPQDDNRPFEIDLGDVTARVLFKWNVNTTGDDEISIEVDPSHTVSPRTLTVQEGAIGTACVYDQSGVGM